MRNLRFLAVFVPLLFAVPEAHAATKESKERAAKKACLTGDVAKGVDILSDLYIDTNDPNYIFNQGRCFEQNSRYEDAIGRFREYLRKISGTSNADKADAESAQKHIADCEALLAKKDSGTEQSASAEAPNATSSVAPEPQAVAPVPAPGDELVVAIQQVPASNTGAAGSGLRTAGVVTAAVGGAALITGLVLNLKVNSMSSDLEKNYSPSSDSTRKDYKTFGWVSYGVGTACVAGAAVLYYLGWRKGHDSSTAVALVPTVGAGMAGAILTGAF